MNPQYLAAVAAMLNMLANCQRGKAPESLTADLIRLYAEDFASEGFRLADLTEIGKRARREKEFFCSIAELLEIGRQMRHEAWMNRRPLAALPEPKRSPEETAKAQAQIAQIRRMCAGAVKSL